MCAFERRLQVVAVEEQEKTVERLRGALEARKETVFAHLLDSFAEGLLFRDIDIAVGTEGIAKEQAWDYGAQLAVELAQILEFKVDAWLLNYAPVGFCINAVDGILLLSRDDEFRLNFIEHVSRSYMDFSWLARQMLKEALR